MKKMISTAVLIFLSLAVNNLLAAEKPMVTPYFSIELPSGMLQSFHKAHKKLGLYQYVYNTKKNDHVGNQLRISVIKQVPSKKVTKKQWEYGVLGNMMSIYVRASGLTFDKQKTVLSKKPETVAVNGNSFTSASMLFQNALKVRFMAGVVKGATYMITLVAYNKDEAMRKKQMQALKTSVGTMKLFGAK